MVPMVEIQLVVVMTLPVVRVLGELFLLKHLYHLQELAFQPMGERVAVKPLQGMRLKGLAVAL